jgi:hypothetical protein
MTSREILERKRQRTRSVVRDIEWERRELDPWEGHVPALLALACGLAAAWIVVVAILSVRLLGWV